LTPANQTALDSFYRINRDVNATSKKIKRSFSKSEIKD